MFRMINKLTTNFFDEFINYLTNIKIFNKYFKVIYFKNF